MRPVNLPVLPASYKEVDLKDRDVKTVEYDDYDPYRGRKKSRKISDITSDLGGFIEKRALTQFVDDANGLFPLSANDDKNIALNKDYTSYQNSVASDHDYGQARSGLIDGIGAFCSYCELPMPAALAVEHRLPKVYFPEYFLNWSNFLVACPICNSTKGDKPNQELDELYVSNVDAAKALEKNYAWPNSYVKNYIADDLLPFQYKLKSITITGNKYVVGAEIADPANYNGDNLVDEYANGSGGIQNNAFCIVKYPVNIGPFKPGPQFDIYAKYFAVFITARDNIAHKNLENAMNKTIVMTGLNAIAAPSNQSLTDYRMPLRTQAYFRALRLRKLFDDITANGVSAKIDFTSMLRNAMTATGFWGVWLTVFKDVLNIQPDLITAFTGTNNLNWTV